MYRIIAGKWKAKRILAPKTFDVRPTTDFAKEALFSILENRYDFISSSVLDLFAGIGSISLEFASRGCEDITLVEMNPKHTAFIHTTAVDLDLIGQLNIQRGDAFQWLKKNKERKQYHIIFADPPFQETSEEQYQMLISEVLNGGYLQPNGMLVLEHQSRLDFSNANLIEKRKYGNVSFSLFQMVQES